MIQKTSSSWSDIPSSSTVFLVDSYEFGPTWSQVNPLPLSKLLTVYASTDAESDLVSTVYPPSDSESILK